MFAATNNNESKKLTGNNLYLHNTRTATTTVNDKCLQRNGRSGNDDAISDVSSLTDGGDLEDANETMQKTVGDKINKRRKSKFTVTKAPKNVAKSSTTKPTNDAVSISFLNNGNSTPKKPAVKQVIQKALASLRPGGVFFVLDYKDDDPNPQITSKRSNRSPTTGSLSMSPSNHTKLTMTSSSGPPSPASTSTSRAIKEIDEDLIKQWNLTMVPTNLEMYYKNKTNNNDTRKTPPSSLATSNRIVRWMGVKPGPRSPVSK